MGMLARAVTAQPTGEAERHQALMALLVSCLFFELDTMPVYIDGRYHCEGSIRCRSSLALQAMLRQHAHGLEFFNGDTSLASFVDLKDLCSGCSQYRKVVRFSTVSMGDDIKLCIKWDGLTQSRYLSGMPRELAWFIEIQGLDDPFGHAASQTLHREPCSRCPSNRTTKQPLDLTLEERPAKKVRLNQASRA